MKGKKIEGNKSDIFWWQTEVTQIGPCCVALLLSFCSLQSVSRRNRIENQSSIIMH